MIIEQPKKKKKKKNDKTEIEDRTSSFVIELAHVFLRFFFVFSFVHNKEEHAREMRHSFRDFFTWVFTSFDRTLRTVHVIDETTILLNREKASNFSTNATGFCLRNRKKKGCRTKLYVRSKITRTRRRSLL